MAVGTTAAWDLRQLTGAMRTTGALAPGAEVVAVESVPLGSGLLADTFRLEVTYDPAGAGPSSVVAKMPSADESAARTAASLGAYQRECRFYRELAPQLDTRTPMLHGILDVDGEAVGMLLEDLSTAATAGDLLDTSGTDRLEGARRELAGLQAPLWDDARIGAKDWLHRRMGVPIPELAERYARSWRLAEPRLGSALEPDERRVIERFAAVCEDWARTLPAPYTLVHHDFRFDNLMFSGDRVWVLDWQIVGWGAPMWDLAYLIGSSVDPDRRRAIEANTVRRHVDDLSQRGVPALSHAWGWESYRRLSAAILLVIVPAAGTVRETERGDRMLVQMLRRGARQALDLDAEEYFAA